MSVIMEQLKSAVIEVVPDKDAATKVSYLPHQSVLREQAETTKVRVRYMMLHARIGQLYGKPRTLNQGRLRETTVLGSSNNQQCTIITSKLKKRYMKLSIISNAIQRFHE